MTPFQKFLISFLIALTGLIVLSSLGWIRWWVSIAFVIISLGLILKNSLNIRSGFFIESFNRAIPSEEKKIALTFDDGPHPATLQVLDVLKKKGVKATFFCIGKNIEKHPDIFRKIIAEGHSVGNHSYSHSPFIGFFSSKKIEREIQQTDLLIQSFTNKKNNWYRPPFGVTNPHIASAIKRLEHRVIGWNVRSLDTIIADERKIVTRITSRLCPGSVVLLHDTSVKTANVLEQLLLFLEQQNYLPVTVEQMIGYEK
ncbi:MAG TPA: polysaccharide deacetylase family protein [Flavobacteriaceae bacterium]|nr:polysaccharide deacetylase family protein [Flavobacteriaceae bacterium]